jgi:hypothetical protein
MQSAALVFGVFGAFGLVGACAESVHSPGLGTTRPSPDAPAAADILQAARTAYATAATYKDQGTLSAWFAGENPLSTTQTFETAFVRGERFHFTSDDPKHKWLSVSITSDFEHTYFSPSGDHSHDYGEHLTQALSEGVVVPGIAVTAFLMPNVFTKGSQVLPADPVVVGLDSIDGHDCWRIDGTYGSDGRGTLWIDRDEYLIRRFALRIPDAEINVSYQPKLGEPITAATYGVTAIAER